MVKKGDDGGEKDDFLLWKSFTDDIEPIKDPKWDEKEKNLDKQPNHKKACPRENVVISEPKKTLSHVTPDSFQLDKRTGERLRKGKIKIEGTLDLHGYNQPQAKQALESFIMSAAAQGKRCVLVITGKGRTGKMSEDWLSPEPGILKVRVPEWLSLSPLRPYVLQFTPAVRSHGGEGALYVYLKKRNKN